MGKNEEDDQVLGRSRMQGFGWIDLARPFLKLDFISKYIDRANRRFRCPIHGGPDEERCHKQYLSLLVVRPELHLFFIEYVADNPLF